MKQVVGTEGLGPTGVPGHHRPNLAKQLKCQPLRCGSRHPQALLPPAEDFSCDIAARLVCDSAGEIAPLAAKSSHFWRQRRPRPPISLKAAAAAERPIWRAPASPQLRTWLARWATEFCPARSKRRIAHELASK